MFNINNSTMQKFTNFNVPKISGIYCIYNNINHKRYIGSAVNLHERLIRHLHELKTNQHFNDHLQHSVEKYSIDAFYIDIIQSFDSIDYEKLLDLEDFYILKYNTLDPDSGYNLRLNSSFPILSEESVLKRKQKHNSHKIKIKAFYAKTGEFYKDYNSITECAYDLHDQTSNISKALKSLTRQVKGFILIKASEYDSTKCYKQVFNRVNTEETKLKKRKNNTRNKIIYVLTKESKIEYFSISEAARQLNLKSDSLCHLLKKHKNICYKEFLISFDSDASYDMYKTTWLYEPGFIKNKLIKNK